MHHETHFLHPSQILTLDAPFNWRQQLRDVVKAMSDRTSDTALPLRSLSLSLSLSPSLPHPSLSLPTLASHFFLVHTLFLLQHRLQVHITHGLPLFLFAHCTECLLFLAPVHTGRTSRFARKFACKPFNVACNLCEHSHLLLCVP